MKKMKIDILGITETRWTESGKIRKDSHTILYSSGQEHRIGVGIQMKNITRSIMGYLPISNRVIINCKENHSTSTYYKHMFQPKITMMRT